MRPLLAFAAAVDRLQEVVGSLLKWLTLLMVLIGAYNAVVRYLGKRLGANLSSNTYIEAQWYLFSLVFLLGAGYTLRHGAHVRVDVLYSHLGRRGQALIDIGGTILFLLPFCLLLLWSCWPAVLSSWSVREMSPDAGGLPRYPLKSALPVAFSLLILQGLSELCKRLPAALGRDA